MVIRNYVMTKINIALTKFTMYVGKYAVAQALFLLL
jgi:hypothetical protein